MKILIVEDEILIQKSLKRMLEKRGVTVMCTASGREAIDYISKEKFDRIICDLMLQDISGFDILEESKRFYTPSEISTIFVIITAYSSSQVLLTAQKYGCTILSKPFDNLDKVIEIFIGDHHDKAKEEI